MKNRYKKKSRIPPYTYTSNIERCNFSNIYIKKSAHAQILFVSVTLIIITRLNFFWFISNVLALNDAFFFLFAIILWRHLQKKNVWLKKKELIHMLYVVNTIIGHRQNKNHIAIFFPRTWSFSFSIDRLMCSPLSLSL